MVNQNLEIIEVAFAIIAPWSRKDLLDVRVMTLLLGHLGVGLGGRRVASR
jgi:hypothetical protein